MHRILIFGSCVSRDAFNFSEQDEFEITGYYARSSLAAFSGSPVLDAEIVERIQSKFQQRMVSYDMQHRFFLDIQNIDADVLILDLIDERFPLMVRPDGAIHTVSLEYSNATKELPLIGRTIPFWNEERRELWQSGWKRFLSAISKSALAGRLVLNRVFWSETDSTGAALENIEWIRNANSVLSFMYERLEADVPDIRSLTYDRSVFISDINHQWGRTPFHYTEPFYHHTLNQLRTLLQDSI